jgi:WD40 repeat protein
MTKTNGGAGPGVRPGWRWDVALSFAGAQRDYVQQVAQALQARGMRCFYDADRQVELWGKNLAEELPVIYGEQAAAVVVFVSAEYAARDWTRLERRAALNRAVRERREYVLPARFDDTPLPGLLSDMVAIDLRNRTPQQFAAMIAAKLAALGIVVSVPPAVPHTTAPGRPPQSAPAPVPPSHLARTLTGHTGWVHGVAFSPDGRLLATASKDGTARLWDLVTGKQLRNLVGHSPVVGVAFSPDGRMLATASEDRRARVYVPVPPSHLARTLTGHDGPVVGVAFSPDGRLLATASEDKTARVWDPVTGKHLRTLTGHDGPVVGVAFSPDGRLLATVGGGDRTARVWDTASGEHLRSLTGHGDYVVGVAFSPDGRLLATASYDWTAWVWDPVTGEHLRALIGHDGFVIGVAFSPDGLLATASLDKTARVWDPATGEHLRTLTGHTARVVGVAFSSDGRLLATASEDRTARVWD